MNLEFTESILASCFPFYLSVDENWRLEYGAIPRKNDG